MKPILRLLILTLSMSLLSGCTFLLWYKQPEVKIVANDKLSVIGKMQKENEERLILFGEQYWLLLDKESSDRLSLFFTTKFSQPFVFSDHSLNFNIKANNLASIPNIYLLAGKALAIQLTSRNQKQFWGSASMLYKNATEEEEAVLKLFCQKLTDWWKCNLNFSGEIYEKGEEAVNLQNYKVEFTLPMIIFYETTERSLGDISKNLILTPFTLVGDVIILPFLALREMAN